MIRTSENRNVRSRLARVRRWGVIAQSALLLGIVLVACVIVTPVAGIVSGFAGVAAALVAAGLCLLGAGLALVACRLFRGPKRVLPAVLAGMLLRMGIPLASGLALQFEGGPLAEAGLLVYLVVFYPVTLFVETALSLPLGEGSRHPSDVSASVAS